ncbi:peptidoglycan-binding protein [Curtobacterium sp. 9128]|uniref:peptidoglycan-binding domain-containing protein n=1 Tax=Curtobacterium sp. 9128 TaxID=1793722 RepID=UPI0011A455E6|nr:peptidoglycan-binding domain-containing protein [Curtobacterium sp. 9128]
MIGTTKLIAAAAATMTLVGLSVLDTGASDTAEAATACVNSTFRDGSTGHCVYDIQELVNDRGIGPYRLTVDGVFGAQTKADVMKLQSAYGYTHDGIVGPQTWRLVCQKYEATGPQVDAGCKAIQWG